MAKKTKPAPVEAPNPEHVSLAACHGRTRRETLEGVLLGELRLWEEERVLVARLLKKGASEAERRAAIDAHLAEHEADLVRRYAARERSEKAAAPKSAERVAARLEGAE